jgi:hypothetical protein
MQCDFFKYDDNNYPTRMNALHSRLQAKIPKMLMHELHPGYDYYIWLDGNFSLVDSSAISNFINSCTNKDACFFAHPYRATVGEEFGFMLDHTNSNPYLIKRYLFEFFDDQYKEYCKAPGYLTEPLWACGSFIYSKSLLEKQDFNIMQQWFYHNCRYSVQDQLSLPYLMLLNKDVYNFGTLVGNLLGDNKYVLYHGGH